MRKISKIAEVVIYGSGEKIIEKYVPPLNLKSIPKQLINDIDTLKQTAAHNKVVSLSANQISITQRMFAILKSNLIQPGKWLNYQNVSKPQDYEIVINPTLIKQSTLKLKDFQQCPSLPGFRFHVWNPIHQQYQYISPIEGRNGLKFQQKRIELKGFKARIWDHQVRHLEGFIALDANISHGEFSVSEQYQDNPGMHEMVQLLKFQLEKTSPQSMKKVFVRDNNQEKMDTILSPDNIPEKISPKMRGRMNQQYIKIKSRLEKQNLKNKN